MSEESPPVQPSRSRRLHTTARTGWGLVVGTGVLVALVGGVLALLDRASPVPTARPAPTTPIS